MDIATRHTLDFVTRHMLPGASLLEVGCGEGALAAALAERGFRILAVDNDAAAVEAARRRGVPARCADFADVGFGPVDAVLFSRSLHHIAELDAAVAHAHAGLRPGGVVLVEDFDYPGADEATLGWFLTALRALDAESGIEDTTLQSLMNADDPLRAWREDHDHDLHGIDTLRDALAACFGTVHARGTAYLYRYVARALPRGDAALAQFFEAERAAINNGTIRAIGQRLRAQRARQ